MRRSTCGGPSVVAFTPRQVLLFDHRLKSPLVSTAMAIDGSEQKASSITGNESQLKVGDDSVLTYSVALWLADKGFSKVLKRFLSAAQIQEDNWKDMALDLNDIFSKYQETMSVVQKDIPSPEKPGREVVLRTDTNGEADSLVTQESKRIKKVKKKKKSESNGDADAACNISSDDLKITKKQVHEESENVKGKKKTKGDPTVTDARSVPENGLCETKERDKHGDQSMKKKDKKKRNSGPQSLETGEKNPDDESAVFEKSKSTINDAAEDGFSPSKKTSKKRARMALDGENDPGSEKAVEEEKSKRVKISKEGQSDIPIAEANGHLDEKNGQNDLLASQVSPKSNSRHADESTDNYLVNGAQNTSGSKSKRQKTGNSSEPKTVNAFQRVKIDEVKFADDRLQDNSYWAKDGAENGYGAKAQEVLGQVKGRDFRHEKTKKKRGSYRGGQIDLDSHSIKFNYSDEE